ncbi:MAG: MBL fold metallo-hydrolase [Candidatus Binatia bacterium]
MATLRTADRWFERRSVGDGVTWITEPHVHPLIRCNIWHIRGRDRDLLIDTGLGVASLREELADVLDHPLIAAATHLHYDHVGSLHEFDDRRIHPSEAVQMRDYGEFQALRRQDFPDFAVEALTAVGYVLDAEVLLDALPEQDFDPAAYAVRSTHATATIDEGDVIDLGDRHFEVLHLPGHTHGSVGLFEAATGILFSGDAIYDGPLIDILPESDIVTYVATMKRLRELNVSVVHGGHEPSFDRRRLVELIDEYLRNRG